MQKTAVDSQHLIGRQKALGYEAELDKGYTKFNQGIMVKGRREHGIQR